MGHRAHIITTRRNSLPHSVQLTPIATATPAIAAVRKKLIIVLQSVVPRIEQVFHIPLYHDQSVLSLSMQEYKSAQNTYRFAHQSRPFHSAKLAIFSCNSVLFIIFAEK
jgi:hypothetical protein